MADPNSPMDTPDSTRHPGKDKFDTLLLAKSGTRENPDGICTFSDIVRLEAEQTKRLRECITGDESKRPAVIKFKIFWKLCSRIPVAGRIVEQFEAAYFKGTAFAITPTALLTARHIFRPPTAQEVLARHPQAQYDLKEIEEVIKYELWVMLPIKWCIGDAGYELSKTIILGNDFVILRSLEKEHHRLALAADGQGSRCWSVGAADLGTDNEPPFWIGNWHWKMKGVKGVTTCLTDDRILGGPLLNVHGHAIGIITNTTGKPNDTILGQFYGSAFVLKCISECFPELVAELRLGGLTEESFPGRFVHPAVVTSAIDYTRALSYNNPDSGAEDSDNDLKGVVKKRQKRRSKVLKQREIEGFIGKRKTQKLIK
ncbi:hypothetical protein TWF281_011336 [Arthrobotrys megalospora]